MPHEFCLQVFVAEYNFLEVVDFNFDAEIQIFVVRCEKINLVNNKKPAKSNKLKK